MSLRIVTRNGVAALLAGVALACAGPGAVPEKAPLATNVRFAPLVPDDADEASADLAAAALTGDAPGAYDALARIEKFDDEQHAEGEHRTGLAPVAQDVANATAEPGREYLNASRTLLTRHDVDPAMRTRLERSDDADPLVRADKRVNEARLTAFARAFNAVAEPIGKSILTTALAPARLGLSVARYLVGLYREDPLPLQRRQALAQWKQFLARYPDDPQSASVARRAEKAEQEWQRMLKQRALVAGRDALEDGRANEAAAMAERALRIAPDDRAAQRLLERASKIEDAQLAAAQESSRFELPPGAELLPEGTRELTLALLDPAGNVRAVLAALPDNSPIADEARYARALTLISAGREDDADALLAHIAAGGGLMARHAGATLADPEQTPWRHFVDARSRDRRQTARFVVTGTARLPQMTPDGVALWLLDLPGMASDMASLPFRVIQLPWLPPAPTARRTSIHAQRYLALHPHGAHAETVRAWVEAYEAERGNHVAALRMAEERDPVPDLQPLREKAAKQSLEVAKKEQRLDLRIAMYEQISQRYSGTKDGDEAKKLLLDEIKNATPQRIAMSRRFLIENPDVAGVRGLGLDPTLLDGKPSNGELHKEGVALVGGRRIELAYVSASGDEDDPPERRTVEVSADQLARVVARLEETSFRNSLLDDEDPVVPDARRDLAFERARLGLADHIDKRPEARAVYTYQGMQERYGMVRARDPWLPFDLVLQGSLADLSLGAFPRWREPKKTPDANLYD